METAAENGRGGLVRIGQRKRVQQFRFRWHWPVNVRGFREWIVFHVTRTALCADDTRAVIFGLEKRMVGIFPNFERAAVNGKGGYRRPVFIGKIVVLPLRQVA